MLAAVCSNYATILGQFDTLTVWRAWSLAHQTNLLIMGIGAVIADDERTLVAFITNRGLPLISLKKHEECPNVHCMERRRGLQDLNREIESVFLRQAATIRETPVPYDASSNDKEWDMMLYVSQGYSNEEIADAMELNLQTVKNNLSSIMKRAQCKNRVQLALKVREGRIHLSNHGS